jgi:DNA-binding beta-propeller fold protein YncE
VIEYWGPTAPSPGTLRQTFVSGDQGTFYFSWLGGLKFRPNNGNLLVADGYGVYEFNGATGQYVRTFAEDISPVGLDINPSTGRLAVTDGSSNQIVEYNLATGANAGTLVQPGASGLSCPYGIVFGGPSNDLFVASNCDQRVLEFNPTNGTFVRTIPSTTLSGFGSPIGVVKRQSDSHLFVASQDDDKIYEFDSNGQLVTSFGGGGLIAPTFLVFKP